MTTRLHVSVATSLAALVLIPAAAQADGGVLLSGYAPSGASAQAVLGTSLPAAKAPAKASHGMPLAAARGSVVVTPEDPAVTGGSGSSSSSGTSADRHAAVSSVRPTGRTSAAAATPEGRAVVAAASSSAGGLFRGQDALVGALVAVFAFGLAALWRRRES